MIELRSWQNLAAFARYGTLTQAARHLHISQPALSQALSRLEQELGLSLFDRTSRNRLILNETGKKAAGMAAALLAQAEEMEARLRDSLPVNVGICAPVPLWNLEQPLKAAFHKDIRLTMEEDPRKLLAQVKSGQLQLAVVPANPHDPAITAVYWMKETLSLAVPENHPLAARDTITLGDLKGQNVLLYRNIGFWNEVVCQRLADTHFLSVDNWSTFGEAAGLHAFPYFVSDCLQDNHAVRTIPVDTLSLSYWLICLQTNRDMRRFAQTFCAAAAEKARPGN